MKCSTNRMLLNTHMNANIQLVIHSLFWDTFPCMTRFFPRYFPDISLTVNKIPDMFKIPGHLQVIQTSGHREMCVCVATVQWTGVLHGQAETGHDGSADAARDRQRHQPRYDDVSED